MVTVSITGKPGDKTDEFDASERRSDWDNIWANMYKKKKPCRQ
jgi:hypothetical protein